MHRRLLIVLVLVALAATPVIADHSWGGYHWARTSNPFTLIVNDNLSSSWEPYLTEARNDWNQSTVLDLNVIWQNPLTSVRKCGSVAGQIEICNTTYGQNGWLGIAGISISGSHITKAYTKLNDSYFNMAQYNTPAWKRLVTCQEIGHDFGLDHQDEVQTNANLGSCMDYTNDPDGGAGGGSSNDPSNEHPNAHDFSMIQSIYSHLDSTTTISSILDQVSASALRPRTVHEVLADAGQWGMPVRFDKQGRPNLFILPVGVNAQGEAELELVHVFWTLDAKPGNGGGNGNGHHE